MLFALIDCNNFYASCERAFNPALEKKPIVVLSNNDGCIISRSGEAKKLGIPMGAPFFQWQAFCRKHRVQVYSSNYELYGDISQRVMTILKEHYDKIEIYSIDEAFLQLPDTISLSEMLSLRNTIKTCTGIPVSIGISLTKTLAKAANQLAKVSDNGVFFLSQENIDQLTQLPVDKVWGVGHRLAIKLKKLNIDTAKALRDADPHQIRLHFNVTLEKTVRELQGIPCLELEKPQPRKQIISSRSFSKQVNHLNELEEAISYYTQIAAKKLRKQGCVTSALCVFLQTNMFKENQPQYVNSLGYPLPIPTADTRYLISVAKKCLRHIYRKEYFYHKAGVMLLDISQNKVRQYDLLNPALDLKSESLMQTLDNINDQMGKNTLFIAAEGIKRSWLVKFEHRSSRYTTRWQELPYVS